MQQKSGGALFFLAVHVFSFPTTASLYAIDMQQFPFRWKAF